MLKNMRPNQIRFRLFIVPICLLLFVVSSCVKIKPTIAVVYIRNSNGSMCVGADVRLYGQPVSVTTSNANQELRIDMLKQTDSEGRAYFDLSKFYQAGQTGMAILNVDAQNGGAVSTGYIQIIEQESNEETFFLQ
jgi:hypothetical protein